jgi:hypothetical protein
LCFRSRPLFYAVAVAALMIMISGVEAEDICVICPYRLGLSV